MLSCPACLTTVCLDCQQHAEEEGQFRAMFVMNCRCVPVQRPVCHTLQAETWAALHLACMAPQLV